MISEAKKETDSLHLIMPDIHILQWAHEHADVPETAGHQQADNTFPYQMAKFACPQNTNFFMNKMQKTTFLLKIFRAATQHRIEKGLTS